MSFRKIFPSVILSLLLLSIASCSTGKRELAYFQDLSKSDNGILPTLPYTSTIEPETELIILVQSEIPEASAEFNPPYFNPVSTGAKEISTQSQVRPYKVDREGNIDFPRLGKLHVAGMTTYDLKDMLTKRISEYVKDPIVSVTITNYRVVVMGEVKEPKTVLTTADRFSVLDALAEAQDLTEYAQRDNILVLRRTSDNQIEYHRINLHDSKITQEPGFWLKNNDVVLVSPNRIKEDNSKYNQNNSYKLSVISTIVGMSSTIVSLVIALVVK